MTLIGGGTGVYDVTNSREIAFKSAPNPEPKHWYVCMYVCMYMSYRYIYKYINYDIIKVNRISRVIL